MRRVSDEEIEQLRFRSNSTPEEFERVMKLLWNAGLMKPHSSYSGSSAKCGSYGTVFNGYFYLNCEWTGDQTLLEWLRTHFTPSGFNWQLDDWGRRRFRKLRAREPRLRAWFGPRSVAWNVEFNDEPTWHEQLEARFELRDWFFDKATKEQIESWFSS